MTNKGIIVALLIVIALGGIIYVSMPKSEKITEAPTGIATKETVMQTQEVMGSSTPAPSSSASSDEIIDYLVNDIVKDETAVAKATIDTTSPQPQATSTVGVGTGL